MLTITGCQLNLRLQRAVYLYPSLCWLLTKCEFLSFHIVSMYLIPYAMRIRYCICLIRNFSRCWLVWEFWDPKVHFLYLVQRASYDDTYWSSFLLVLDWSHDLHEAEVYSIVTAVFSWVHEQQQCLWSRKNQCVRLPAAAREIGPVVTVISLRCFMCREVRIPESLRSVALLHKYHTSTIWRSIAAVQNRHIRNVKREFTLIAARHGASRVDHLPWLKMLHLTCSLQQQCQVCERRDQMMYQELP
jgi:hypothetical protein